MWVAMEEDEAASRVWEALASEASGSFPGGALTLLKYMERSSSFVLVALNSHQH